MLTPSLMIFKTVIFALIFSLESFAGSKHLICHYYKLNHNPSSDNFGTSDGGYLWAGVDVPGYAEDGFWLTSLKQSQAVRVCEKLIETQKGSDHRLLSIKAAGTLSEYSIVFSDTQKRLVIFGDSYSDDGNLNRWFPSYPASPYFHGRFSNGPVWTEYLSLHQNIAVQNWAYGGTTTEPFLKLETLAAGNLRKYVIRYINTNNNHIYSPESTTFVFWAGPNDFYHGSNSDRIIKNIQKYIMLLAQAGAKYFAVLNTLDFSISPCSECYKHTQILNNIWAKEWRDFSIPGTKITLIDAEAIHRKIVAGNLGFQANNTQCFKGWWSKGSENPAADTCPKVSESFFYDDVHPTTAAHCWLSLFIYSELSRTSPNDVKIEQIRRFCRPTP